MAANVPRSEPLADHAVPLDPDTDWAQLACYPCAHFDTVRLPRGVPGADTRAYPRCAQGFASCPWLGPRCVAYDPTPQHGGAVRGRDRHHPHLEDAT